MKITLGLNYFEARNGGEQPLVWDSSQLINGHALILGASGTGKSHTIRKMIRRGQRSDPNVRFHVFDVHGDLDIPGASEVRFSESAPYGLNPLKVNPDPHFGGVRKCIQIFLNTIDQASTTQLGVKQRAVISNLLIDVFSEFEFDIENPATWAINAAQVTLAGGHTQNRLYLDVPIQEKDEAKAFGARWDPAKRLWWIHTEHYAGEITRWTPAVRDRRYPTIADVLDYARNLHQQRFIGSDQRAVRALMALNKEAQAYHRLVLNAVSMQNIHGAGIEVEMREMLEKAKDEAVLAFKAYAQSIQTGHELDLLIKYDSIEVLKSVIDRLSNLQRTGIFKSSLPPFNPRASVWRYRINALSAEEKKLLVLFRLQEIFREAVERGEQPDVCEIVVLDELASFTNSKDAEDGDGIIGTICREGRKFGLAFWGATQSPVGVPESLVSSTATKMLLGIDERYWREAVTKLRVEENLLDWIRSQVSAGVQLKLRGALKSRWWWTQLEESVEHGR